MRAGAREAIKAGNSFDQTVSVHTMEELNLSMGVDAGEFLDQLLHPAPQQEAEFIVATADSKGAPLLTKDAAKVKAFQTVAIDGRTTKRF